MSTARKSVCLRHLFFFVGHIDDTQEPAKLLPIHRAASMAVWSERMHEPTPVSDTGVVEDRAGRLRLDLGST
jgi:hypothetical protein